MFFEVQAARSLARTIRTVTRSSRGSSQSKSTARSQSLTWAGVTLCSKAARPSASPAADSKYDLAIAFSDKEIPDLGKASLVAESSCGNTENGLFLLGGVPESRCAMAVAEECSVDARFRAQYDRMECIEVPKLINWSTSIHSQKPRVLGNGVDLSITFC